MSRLTPVVAPRLPAATVEYDQRFIDQFTNALRLYFNQLDSQSGALIGSLGGQFINAPHGAFQSNANQTVATINTPTLIALEVTDFSNGVYRTIGDGIHVQQSGIYNLQYSVQVTNTDTQAHDFAIWLRKNGADIAMTNSVFSILGTHGGQPGYFVGACNFYVELLAGEYVELWWSTNSTQVSLQTLPAITTPFIAPGAPSAVCTLSFVSSLAK